MKHTWLHAHRRFALLLLVLIGPCAAADKSAPAGITVNGFGTLGAVYHDAEGLEIRRSVAQARGARAGEIDLATDSLFGLQLQGSIGTDLSLVVQGVTRLNADDNWWPQFTRGFVRYAPSASSMLRVGRIGFEAYLQADALDVGHSYVPIRPPVELYGSISADHFDGVDITLTRPFRQGLGRMRLLGGAMSGASAQADGSVNELTDTSIYGASVDYLFGGWQLRTALLRLHVGGRAALEPLIAGLRATGIEAAAALAGELANGRGNTLVGELGVTYDRGPLQAQAVYIHLNSDSPPGPELDNGLVLLAYRYHAFTPYALFAVSKSFAALRPTGLAGIAPLAKLQAAAQQVQTAGQTTQRTLSVGVRYDFARQMDLKLQIDHAWLRDTPLVFDRRFPSRERASMTIFGLALDVMF